MFSDWSILPLTESEPRSVQGWCLHQDQEESEDCSQDSSQGQPTAHISYCHEPWDAQRGRLVRTQYGEYLLTVRSCGGVYIYCCTSYLVFTKLCVGGDWCSYPGNLTLRRLRSRASWSKSPPNSFLKLLILITILFINVHKDEEKCSKSEPLLCSLLWFWFDWSQSLNVLCF